MTSRPQIPHRSLPSLLVLVAALSGAATPRATSAEIKTFGDMATFLAETGGAAATGALPDLGLVTTATVGSVTFGVAPGGDNLAIGAAGTLAAPDWYALLPGNDIALGFENLSVATAAPVYALGWEFAQPDVTMPSFGGLAVDSTYEVSLYHGATLVGQAQFTSIPTDVVTFLGVWSSAPFTHAEIVDVTQSPFVDDDEFFGEFFSGTTPTSTTVSKPGGTLIRRVSTISARSRAGRSFQSRALASHAARFAVPASVQVRTRSFVFAGSWTASSHGERSSSTRQLGPSGRGSRRSKRAERYSPHAPVARSDEAILTSVCIDFLC
ncbi:MAG: hypothetical protein HUU21_21640 [Polyangiaceae bacterium]|nr:hypothetical protein [Polyangiaceae bacterium]